MSSDHQRWSQSCTAGQSLCSSSFFFLPITRYEVYNNSSLYTVLIKPQRTTLFTNSWVASSAASSFSLRASSGAVSCFLLKAASESAPRIFSTGKLQLRPHAGFYRLPGQLSSFSIHSQTVNSPLFTHAADRTEISTEIPLTSWRSPPGCIFSVFHASVFGPVQSGLQWILGAVCSRSPAGWLQNPGYPSDLESKADWCYKPLACLLLVTPGQGACCHAICCSLSPFVAGTGIKG